MSKLDNKLTEFLEKKEVSQYRLAKSIGVTPMTISNIVHGGTPHFIVALKIAKYFNVTIYQIWNAGEILSQESL